MFWSMASKVKHLTSADKIHMTMGSWMGEIRCIDPRNGTSWHNSPTFSPHSFVLPTLLQDFAEKYDLAFASVPGPCTAEQMESWMTDRQCKLMKQDNGGQVQMLWKWSWQSNWEWWRLQGHPTQQGWWLQGLLAEYRSSILYFWKVADRFDILKCTMAELNQEQMATTENIPMASQLTAINNKK